jgi:hypothetical protein
MIQVHLFVILHLVGTWVFSCCGILVSLGGCRHLDGLEQLGGGLAPSPTKRQRQY